MRKKIILITPILLMLVMAGTALAQDAWYEIEESSAISYTTAPASNYVETSNSADITVALDITNITNIEKASISHDQETAVTIDATAAAAEPEPVDEKPNKPEKPEKPEKPSKPVKPTKPEKPEKPEK